MSESKRKAAIAALPNIQDHRVIGVGTGSTTMYFIEALATIRDKIDACVASSVATALELARHGFSVIDLNAVTELAIYVDGADEVNGRGEMIKGGGGALTREKIIAQVATEFICIVDHSKLVQQLGVFPVAVEVLPLAKNFVARELTKLGGKPIYREDFLTDNGNIILDVFNLDCTQHSVLEDTIKMIPGVIESGLFFKRPADTVIIGNKKEVVIFKK